MKSPEPKPLIVKKKVRHNFTAEETAGLNVEFRQSFANLKAVEAEFDDVKAVWKAKQTSAESRMEVLNATLQAGFEEREKECVVVFRVTEKKKDFFVAAECIENALPQPDQKPVLTEPMTPADFEQDLLRAESAFENRKELELWNVGDDECRIIVGSLNGKWFTAVRGNVGANTIDDRLDSEQRSFKKRPDAVTQAGKRVMDWLKSSIGKDEAAGFFDRIMEVVNGEQEKAE